MKTKPSNTTDVIPAFEKEVDALFNRKKIILICEQFRKQYPENYELFLYTSAKEAMQKAYLHHTQSLASMTLYKCLEDWARSIGNKYLQALAGCKLACSAPKSFFADVGTRFSKEKIDNIKMILDVDIQSQDALAHYKENKYLEAIKLTLGLDQRTAPQNVIDSAKKANVKKMDALQATAFINSVIGLANQIKDLDLSYQLLKNTIDQAPDQTTARICAVYNRIQHFIATRDTVNLTAAQEQLDVLKKRDNPIVVEFANKTLLAMKDIDPNEKREKLVKAFTGFNLKNVTNPALGNWQASPPGIKQAALFEPKRPGL